MLARSQDLQLACDAFVSDFSWMSLNWLQELVCLSLVFSWSFLFHLCKHLKLIKIKFKYYACSQSRNATQQTQDQDQKLQTLIFFCLHPIITNVCIPWASDNPKDSAFISVSDYCIGEQFTHRVWSKNSWSALALEFRLNQDIYFTHFLASLKVEYISHSWLVGLRW